MIKSYLSHEKLLNVLENTKRENDILRIKVIEQSDKCEKD
jgi:hypothetical protein